MDADDADAFSLSASIGERAGVRCRIHQLSTFNSELFLASATFQAHTRLVRKTKRRLLFNQTILRSYGYGLPRKRPNFPSPSNDLPSTRPLGAAWRVRLTGAWSCLEAGHVEFAPL